MRLLRPSLRGLIRKGTESLVPIHTSEEQAHVTDSSAPPERQTEPTSTDSTLSSSGPDARLLHRLAEEAWRLGRRLDRAGADVGEEPLGGVRDALVRLQDLLDEAGVKAVDHDGERYVDGLRLDILHVDGDPPDGAPLRVVRTVRPSILMHDRVAVSGQVILGPLVDTLAPETTTP